MSFHLCYSQAYVFLTRKPLRIGKVYKKAMFRQFTDATYTSQAPRPAWLGFLGPTLRAEVGEVIVVHLKNFATRNYTMHPHGVFYEKNAEGTVTHSTYSLQYVIAGCDLLCFVFLNLYLFCKNMACLMYTNQPQQ